MLVRDIKRKDKVSSEEERKFNEIVISRITNTYHKLKTLIGKIKVLSDCIELLNGTIYSDIQLPDNDNTFLTVNSEFIYPDSIDETEKASIDKKFNCFHAALIGSSSLLVDSKGNLKSSYEITRTSESINYSAATSIEENSIENIFSGNIPYLIKYSCSKGSIYDLLVNIDTSKYPIKANSLQLISMPARDGIMINHFSYNKGNNLKIDGKYDFENESVITKDRKYSAYLHFKPVTIDDFKLSLSSELFSNDLGGVYLGISSFKLLYNTYSVNSYIGFKLTFPEDIASLTKLYLNPYKYNEEVEHITIRLYDTEDGFNNIDSSSRLIINNINSPIKYDKIEGFDDIYVLVEINSVDNTTPCFEYIEVGFE